MRDARAKKRRRATSRRRRPRGIGLLLVRLDPGLQACHQLLVGSRPNDPIRLRTVISGQVDVLDEDLANEPAAVYLQEPRLDGRVTAFPGQDLRLDSRAVAIDLLIPIPDLYVAIFPKRRNVSLLD